MASKTISDCVESLIGAYYVGGGLTAAISFLKWLGMEADFEHSLVDDAIRTASLYCYAPKTEDIGALESKLGYNFSTKGLLLEAITYAVGPIEDVGYCYEVRTTFSDMGFFSLTVCCLYWVVDSSQCIEIKNCFFFSSH